MADSPPNSKAELSRLRRAYRATRIIIVVLFALLIAEGARVVLDKTEEPSVSRSNDDRFIDRPDAAEASRLAHRYRPILMFDSDEPWRPLELDQFFHESNRGARHHLCDRANLAAGCPIALVGLNQFETNVFGTANAQNGKNLAINIAGNARNGTDYSAPRSVECTREPPVVDCDDGPRTAIYYNVLKANGSFYIDYWWFFRFNDFPGFESPQNCEGDFRPGCGDHEGDWEGMTVVTEPENPDEIKYVDYAAHNGTARWEPAHIEFGGEFDTRPVAYIARGSHAAYPDPCFGGPPKIGCLQAATTKVLGVKVRLPEGRHDGMRGWGRNAGGEDGECPPEPGRDCLIPLPPPAAGDGRTWNDFAGLWGRVCSGGPDCPVMFGPRTPGLQARYKAPWCSRPVSPDDRGFLESVNCDVFTPGAKSEATPGVATDADCLAWSATAAVVACGRQSLANDLATEEEVEAAPISITVRRPGQPKQTAEPSETAGLRQFKGKPLRDGSRVWIEGAVSDVILLVQPPRGVRPKRPFEARFTGIQLSPGPPAVIRVQYLEGKPQVSLEKPNGQLLYPVGLRELRFADLRRDSEPSEGEKGAG